MATSDIYQRPIEYCEATIDSVGKDIIGATLLNPLGDISHCAVLADKLKDVVIIKNGNRFGICYYDAIRFNARFFPLEGNQ